MDAAVERRAAWPVRMVVWSALPLNESAPVEKERLKGSVWSTAQSVESRSGHRSVILGYPCC